MRACCIYPLGLARGGWIGEFPAEKVDWESGSAFLKDRCLGAVSRVPLDKETALGREALGKWLFRSNGWRSNDHA